LPGPDHVFLGVGSDEVIDLFMRVCVALGREKILITPPTYGMYEEKRAVSACVWMRYVSITVLGVNVIDRSFMQAEKTIDADPSIKLIFLYLPENPAGTFISLTSIRALLDYEPFKGIVVVDETYIDFSEPGSSAASLVAEYANICVMQTLSKGFGLT
jgi:histidinol-phosphate aminotransferase